MKFQIDRASLTFSGIPGYMHGGIIRFYEDGIPPGGFLTAVIDNDLKTALAKADDTNQQLLREYVMWFYNYAPSGTWGYTGATDKYLKQFHEGEAA